MISSLVSALEIVLCIVQSCGISFYVCTDFILAKDSREHL